MATLRAYARGPAAFHSEPATTILRSARRPAASEGARATERTMAPVLHSGASMLTRKIGFLGCTAIVAALTVVVACSDDDDGNAVLVPVGDSSINLPDAITADTSTGDSGQVQGDPQVAQVMLTANTGEVAQGTLAQTSATNTAVKDFATMMVTEHSAANQRVQALVQQLGITPQPNPVSAQLQGESDAIVAQLRTLSGTAFDRAYIDAQVDVHTKVLALIDDTLLPASQAAEVKAELATMRASVAMHLTHAQQLQTQLAAGGDGGTDADAGDAGDAGADADADAPL
jgi:putative membrane protein